MRVIKQYSSLLVAVGLTAVVAGLALYVWDSWILNFDGSGYLTLSRSLRESGTYRFPDGSFATFRGPGFPAFLAAGQLIVGGSVRSAIWIGRSVIVINACLVALVVWRGSKQAIAAGAAGLSAAVMPWPFVSGATLLVPDALASGLVLAGILASWSDRKRMHVLAGVALGSAVLTKETAVFGLVVVLVVMAARNGSMASFARVIAGFAAPLLAWWTIALGISGHLPTPLEGLGGGAAAPLAIGLVALAVLGVMVWSKRHEQRRELPGWVVGVTLALLPVLVYVGLIVGVGLLPADSRGPVKALGDVLLQELYQGTRWWTVLVVLLLAVLWAARSFRSPLASSGLALVGIGLGATVYAAVGGFGVRNGVLAAYGVALLVGFAVASTRDAVPAVRLGVLIAALALFVGNAQATIAVDERSANELVTEQIMAVSDASDFLNGRSPGKVMTTPAYGAAVSSQTAEHMEFTLLPMYASSDPSWPQDLDHLVHWLAQVPTDRSIGTHPVAVSISSNRIVAVDEDLLIESLEAVDYVMLTGNARFNATPFDGGVMLPFFDAAPGAKRVWEQINSGAQWIVIFEISHPFVAGDVDPIYRSSDGALIDGVPSLDLVEYSELVKSLVAAQ